LARLVVEASERSQLIVVSHSDALVRELRRDGQAAVLELVKDFGETVVKDHKPFEGPVWNWGHR
jgi:predicted ATPase